ncbi:GNAT family N-acetyltransferase [Pseudaestuariivita sp.]|uniref:GNAT family N-acetyltransferase n=1 Tax=Pseudaestuariivita sp. TaxID=2211669 RepID=UPI004058AB69
MTRYTFRAMTADDVPMLRTWLATPHVARWWDGEPPPTEADRQDPRVARWIVSLGGHPFAYMQDYTVHGWPDHHFAHLPKGSRGIDQYIGDAALLGQGHGPAFVAQRVAALVAGGAPAVATDPHPDNARAIAAYRKAGFAPEGPPQETPWGLILPMVLHAPTGQA